ncbi:MAG TPA: hypothetical protein VMB26_15425, partial [Candidatus Binataceae bacterium]|nr:hypothetical protein [Candidatus Binataceae bacterium]
IWRFRERGDGCLIISAWLVMAITSLTKGLLGFVLPLLVIGSYASLAEGWKELWRRLAGRDRFIAWLIEQNRWLFNWSSIPAVTIAAVVYYLPFAISHSRMHSSAGITMVFRENVQRFFQPFDHRGPVYLYFGAIFALMAPWCVFLPAALVKAHAKHDAHNKNDRFALIFFWATFVFFTLSGSRRSYYLLPILPAAAMLVARLLAETRGATPNLARRLTNIGYTVLIAAAVFGALILLPPGARPAALRSYPSAPAPIAFALFWLLAIAGVAYTLRDFRPFTMALSTALIAYLASFYVFVFAMPGVERYRSEQPFARTVRIRLNNDLTGLAMYRIWGPGLVFYLSSARPIPEFDQAKALEDFARQNQIHWVIVRERDLASLPAAGPVVATETIFPWELNSRTRNKYLLIKITPQAIPNNDSRH